jgi:hypothetical protein
MSRLDRIAEATDPRKPIASRPDRRRSDQWAPRPSTIATAIVVGLAHFAAVSIDQIVPRGLSGAPGPPPPIDSGGWQPIYVIAIALLASACLTTQILACLFVESPRLTIRSACLWIAVVALFLALWRSGSALVLLLLLTAYGYSLASPIILPLLLVARWSSKRRQPAGRP